MAKAKENSTNSKKGGKWARRLLVLFVALPLAGTLLTAFASGIRSLIPNKPGARICGVVDADTVFMETQDGIEEVDLYGIQVIDMDVLELYTNSNWNVVSVGGSNAKLLKRGDSCLQIQLLRAGAAKSTLADLNYMFREFSMAEQEAPVVESEAESVDESVEAVESVESIDTKPSEESASSSEEPVSEESSVEESSEEPKKRPSNRLF